MEKYTERALSLLEDATKSLKENESWRKQDLAKLAGEIALAQAKDVTPPPYYQKAWFIHGFYIGALLLVFTFMLAAQGTLIHDLLIKK